MQLHRMRPAEVFSTLRTSAAGLSSAEAARRLREFGPNRIEAAPRRSTGRRLMEEFGHFFAIILWIAAVLAFVAESRDPGKGMATLGAAIIAVIVINGLFSFFQVYRAERALASLERLLPRRARVRRDGALADLSATELVPGDVISLTAGDIVPADCRLVEAFDVRVNDATLTGESVPGARVAESADQVANANDGQRRSGRDTLVLAGTTLVSGDAQAVVFATGMRTDFGRIASLAQATPAVSFPLQEELRNLSRLVAFLATALGVAFFLIGLTIPLTFWQNFVFAIGIIVANVPEGLLPTVTLSLAMGAQRMARRNVLIRHLSAVETLGSATVICTDKTGTLTENQMSVARLFLGEHPETVGRSTTPAADTARRRRFFDVLRLCHNLPASSDGAVALGDPMDVALVELARRVLPGETVPERVDELAFDSDRKRISTLHRDGGGLFLATKGALETVLPLCVAAAGEALTAEGRRAWLDAEAAMAGDGLRVLAVAGRRVAEGYRRDALETGLDLLGLVGLEDPPRADAGPAVRACRDAGIKVIMLTGDHPTTALGVARQVGLATASPRVITGGQLAHMSDDQLQLALDEAEIIFARLAADQKMRIVTVLQRKGEIVAVTGDGVNDAPALKKADIGIAMGATGTDVARAAADMVLIDDNFASLVAAVEEGRAVFDNIRKFLAYVLTSNVPELVPYLAYALLNIPLPLTVIQILSVDLGTDMLPALALGAEKPDPAVMRRPPRRRSERLITPGLLARSYLLLGPLEAIAAMAAFLFVLKGAGWEYGQGVAAGDALWPVYLQATTACLAAIVVMQVVNVILCRSETRSAVADGLFGNRLIWLGIAVELTLLGLIVYTETGNAIFGTGPLAAQVWLFLVPLAAGMFAIEELRKLVVRARARS